MANPTLEEKSGIRNMFVDQDKPLNFELLLKTDEGYKRPFLVKFRWGIEGETTEREITYNIDSVNHPPWVLIVVPGGTFPKAQMLSYRFQTHWYTNSGVNNFHTFQHSNFFTIYPPSASTLTPHGGMFLNDVVSNTFLWEINYTKDYTVAEPIKQKAAKLEWRNGEGGSIQAVNAVGAATSYVFPAGTFPSSTNSLQWRVTGTMVDGAVSKPSDWTTLTTIDSLSTARIIAPQGAYLTGNEPQTFTWEHVISTGTEQTKAELRYSADAGENWTMFASVTGAAKSVVVFAGTLPGASLLWQVRTYNSDRVAGNWSEAAPIVVYAAPRAPGLMPVDPVPRPLIRWQSAEQQAFEVKAGEWRSGAVFGTAKEYQVPVWLPDGEVELGVRVQSSLGLWSEWKTIVVTIQNVPPGALSLIAQGVAHGARLSWQGAFDRYLIERDGVEIGGTTDTKWVDWTANGRHRYRVRGVSGAYYALSNEVLEITRCPYGVISALEPIEWIALRVRRGSRPGHAVETTRQTTLRYFAGRGLPVAEVAEAVDRVHTLDYTLRREERELVHALRGLTGKTVLYKDPQGACVVGLLQSVAESCDGAVDVTLSIVETGGGRLDED